MMAAMVSSDSNERDCCRHGKPRYTRATGQLLPKIRICQLSEIEASSDIEPFPILGKVSTNCCQFHATRTAFCHRSCDFSVFSVASKLKVEGSILCYYPYRKPHKRILLNRNYCSNNLSIFRVLFQISDRKNEHEWRE